mmetsp:Transcript_6732/g.17204  ORF Transcript_6732/g.17204 Transcript_6732/m.17204 type:complete len:206 (-) Transcript_6732:376-993(-)
MSNHVQRLLSVLEVEEAAASDALRAILHTILFNRALGAVEPRELALPAFPALRVAACLDNALELTVEDAIAKFYKSLHLVGPDLERGELVLSFYETRKKAGFLGFGAQKEEKLYWERWIIPVIVSRGIAQTSAETESALRTGLLKILLLANDLTHLPRLRGEEDGAIIYKFDLSASPRDAQVGGEAAFLNKMVSKGPPGPLHFSL